MLKVSILVYLFFTARCYDSRQSISCHRVSVSLSIYLSQVGVVQRWLNLGSHQQCHTTAQGLEFSDAENLGEIPTTSPQRGRQIEVG